MCIRDRITLAQAETSKPSILACKTVIGFGSPNKGGTADTHGAPLGDEEIALVRKELGWEHQPFEIPEDIKQAWDAKDKGEESEKTWQLIFEKYQDAHPDLAKELMNRFSNQIEDNRFSGLEDLIKDLQKEADTVATRKSSLIALNALTDDFPELLGGSADLTGSNCTFHKNSKAITPSDAKGDYIFYGVREFGMAAMMNGMVLHGGLIPYGGTFLTFTDYSRNAIRMASMMELGVIHVLTHDSIGLGAVSYTHLTLPTKRIV